MMSYRITVTQRVSDDDLSKPDDRIDNPAGTYDDLDATSEDEALDRFHNSVPIGCLDDFTITVQKLHRLCVTQFCHVERGIILLRAAPTEDDAVAAQSEDDAPSYDDPNWLEYPSLQNETVTVATKADEHDMRCAGSSAVFWPPPSIKARSTPSSAEQSLADIPRSRGTNDPNREALQRLLNWAREHTSPQDANSPHALLVTATQALARDEGRSD